MLQSNGMVCIVMECYVLGSVVLLSGWMCHAQVTLLRVNACQGVLFFLAVYVAALQLRLSAASAAVLIRVLMCKSPA
jgi:hypothetical protein